ncbi:UNVERIFIED_CONTAM: Raucaffricine-O-beta-D-glucosidase [Sesamum latifolium]|uniref:Raucaffricine-O-beta-D-glucosidase n=1 Tax=Sesamum latifolium TaxID=2727402 RepID=A0AAW2UID7_9LAMI
MQAKNGTHVNSVPKKLNLQDSTDISRNDFSEGFIFGTGTSAYQVEGAAAKGGRSISVWDDMTLRTPNMITDGSNGNIACDMYHKYKDDIKLMKQMGFDSYRFSISWPRVLPGGRTFAGFNKEGIGYYNDVINTVIANGMIPFVTLFHWDLPNCLQLEYSGMLSHQIVFLKPVIYGQFPASMLKYAGDNIQPFSHEEKQGLAGSVDWVGLNYYTSDFVAYKPNPKGVGYPADQHCIYSWVADKNDYALTAKQACVDTTRIQYFQEHLASLLQAITSDNDNPMK